MKYLPALLLLVLCSCDSPHFDSDKRQILAMQKIESMLPRKSNTFAVSQFNEDTAAVKIDTTIRQLTRYSFRISYNDSTGKHVSANAETWFARGGTSIINAAITQQP